MIIVMKPGVPKKDTRAVIRKIRELGYTPHTIYGKTRNVIGAIGDERGKIVLQSLESLPGVDRVVPILKPYKLASREVKPEPSEIRLAPGVSVGGKKLLIVAGPCSVESERQMVETARSVKAAGANVLRGGAFKPRTSPYDFQGLEEEGLKLLAEARSITGLKVCTEVMTIDQVELISDYADILQVGARNMQNFPLLKKLGKASKPVLIKRGLAATITEFLMSAEYIVSQGNSQVILCERGIRTFESMTRNTLDIASIPLLIQLSHLPVVVDPSHATGKRSLITPVSKSAVAAGAVGLLIEVHPNPEEAWSDGAQSLTIPEFDDLMAAVRRYLPLEERHI